ncbi:MULTISPECIES: YbhB/YbcL family Raf kinase inhibitor-like protein [Pacificibacter]|uniref:YbhB/YbcL family Raf kinase inhibitor-like protein n=1 Tax=Pacificibacter TaxID=1042323 RepID=UPI001C0A2916|nr:MULTISPECIES: YbhB/YbcL family Raf kinase inhibitor-like protein [Pacificibacter]MBU2935616.1 YbhB/YbcL family Raf kinase inhibitor-like protein [Pacificibacter marinus]MDO6614112.1 YbhB/YbcL family Raf kinase inhibitor-like protein [Pacificibacter sp. 1_MG-2023]
MTMLRIDFSFVAISLCTAAAAAGPVLAQDTFILTSPAIADGGDLPADMKCSRDGGDGLSPPLAWSGMPEGTESLAVIMQHYPRGRVEGVDAPSQYWLLWNIPPETTDLPRGNPASLGDEGADKDGRFTGYTPPCSPAGARHEYKITAYALSTPPETLPASDSLSVDWTVMTQAIQDDVIASSSFSFWN